ncbi:hypothetical protein [Deinococcus aquiradiocola]|uniref:Uncharacterized protein n=1 Tax=Deinococcus aquiradiocola TaxID=393059 RepID=A0A917P696_9DEIO|nr:hypothetical protein [Deinococcus aquiradiocola]GGJ63618.1 hypothetical protein GCM10008939_04340 [Deinococcus aquiradiocola]
MTFTTSARRTAVLGLTALVGTASLAHAATSPIPNLPLSLDTGERLQMLTDKGVQKIFPAGNRPEAVFLSPDSKLSLAFEWRDAKLNKADVATMLTQFPTVIRAQVPGIKSLKQQMVTLNGNEWADFVFVAPSRTGDVRREMLITSAQGRMLVLTISSTIADYSKNEADVKAFTNSIKLN